VTRLDEGPNFIFPASTMYIPSQTISVPGGSTSSPFLLTRSVRDSLLRRCRCRSAFRPKRHDDGSDVPHPRAEHQARQPTNYEAAGNLTWLPFDAACGKATGSNLRAPYSREGEERRTDLEITDSVVRLYYGALLARQLRQVATTRWRAWK